MKLKKNTLKKQMEEKFYQKKTFVSKFILIITFIVLNSLFTATIKKRQRTKPFDIILVK